MRISVALGLVLAGLALPTQNVAAQFLEKKVLTLAAAQRMVAAAQAGRRVVLLAHGDAGLDRFPFVRAAGAPIVVVPGVAAPVAVAASSSA